MTVNPEPSLPPWVVAAAAYRKAGFRGHLPLPPDAKWPPPSGFTGADGADPTRDDMARWVTEGGYGNLALRLPDGVVGIDVDNYDGKPGGQTVADTEKRWGRLPRTWRTTSRWPDDGESGIRLFRVPPGLLFGSPGPGVDVIQRHHRYAVVWPSRHPSGKVYCWVDEGTGEVFADVPTGLAFDTLPELPAAWVEGLAAGEQRNRAKAEYDTAWVSRWLTDGACDKVDAVLARVVDDVGAGQARHDTVRGGLLALLTHGADGHAGVGPALADLREYWTTLSPRGRASDGEWDRMLAGAAAIVAAEPRGQELCECWAPRDAHAGPRTAQDGRTGTGEGDHTRGHLPDNWWACHPVLGLVREHAYSRGIRPETLLVATLVTVNARIPAGYTLPAVVGARGSLNLVAALWGRSGLGKSASTAVAEYITDTVRADWDPELWEQAGRDPGLFVVGLGSGEGIAQSWWEWVTPKPGPDGKKKPGKVLARVRDNVLLVDPEGSGLAAQLSRQGSTLGQTLLKLFSGEDVSFTYSKRSGTGAQATLTMKPLSYRAGVLLGIQPSNAEAFFDLSGSGWPQRILWSTAEGSLPQEWPPEPPVRLGWVPPAEASAGYDVAVDPSIATELRARAAAYRNGATDELDSHAGLVRLKVAATMHCLLNPGEEPAVTAESWRLALDVCAASDEVRGAARAHRERRLAAERRQRTKAAAERAVAVEEAVADAAVKRVAAVLWRTAERHAKAEEGHLCSPSACLRRSVRSTDRGLFAAALEMALDRDWLVERQVDVAANHGDGTRYATGGSTPSRGGYR